MNLFKYYKDERSSGAMHKNSVQLNGKSNIIDSRLDNYLQISDPVDNKDFPHFLNFPELSQKTMAEALDILTAQRLDSNVKL